jgi:hypothetical protein
MWFVGAPVLVALFFYNPSPILIIFALLAVPQMWRVWRGADPDQQRYYDVPLETRSQYALVYLALLGFLALMTYELHQELPRANF